MPGGFQDSGDQAGQLRRKALRRREAALRRVATTRQVIIGGTAAAVCGLAVFIDVLAPSHASATNPKATSASTGAQQGHGGYGGYTEGYGGYGSGSDSQGSFGGSPPASSSGGGSATSGGS